MTNRMQNLSVAAMKPLVLVLLALAVLAPQLLHVPIRLPVSEAAPAQIPPGQLKRKTLVGTVVMIAGDRSSILIGNQVRDRRGGAYERDDRERTAGKERGSGRDQPR